MKRLSYIEDARCLKVKGIPSMFTCEMTSLVVTSYRKTEKGIIMVYDIVRFIEVVNRLFTSTRVVAVDIDVHLLFTCKDLIVHMFSCLVCPVTCRIL